MQKLLKTSSPTISPKNTLINNKLNLIKFFFIILNRPKAESKKKVRRDKIGLGFLNKLNESIIERKKKSLENYSKNFLILYLEIKKKTLRS